MPTVHVPELGRKLDLLRAYSDKRDPEALAAALGGRPKTVAWWVRGDDVRPAEHIPPEAMDKLTTLIAEVLPAGMPEASLRHLVFGPAALLEAKIRTDSLASILEAADTQAARLIPKPDLSLVEVQARRDGPEPHRLALDEWFRIEFPLSSPQPHVVVLQNVQLLWAVLDHASSREDRIIHVPGPNGAGEADYMRERRDTGLHRFVCLAGPKPFPPDLERHRREQTTLTRFDLDELAAVFGAMPPAQRVCQMLAVSIGPVADTA